MDFQLPRFIVLAGYAGLLPFLAGPAWLALSPGTAPAWIDHGWLMYISLVCAFLAGSFWGFSLIAAMGPQGMLGIGISTVLLAMTWVSLMLPTPHSLYCLGATFLLLLLADIWRDRTLGDIPGYFGMRLILTLGALAAIALRLSI